MASPPLYLGVDIGGTKVAAGLVNAAGEIVYKTRVPMVSNQDAETGFAAAGKSASRKAGRGPRSFPKACSGFHGWTAKPGRRAACRTGFPEGLVHTTHGRLHG